MNSAETNKLIREKAYLKRVSLFFGHGVSNIVSALIGAILIVTVMNDTGVENTELIVWFTIVCLFAATVLLVERAFAGTKLTLDNARKWVLSRTISGGVIGAMYGVSPFMFGENLQIHHEMFFFIILSAMISVASTGYTLMPLYYLTLNALTMLPLTVYFFLQASTFHTVLAITSIIWQIVVLSKSWKVSNTAINEIFLNECLRDEIERHEQTKERLQYLATHDNLTGLPTRRFLMDRLDYMIKRSLRYEKMIVVMFVDLDGFKEINDLYGHESGDFALIEISNRLASTIRDTDIVARLGGDEFVLVYTDIDGGTAEAERLAQRILKLLNSPINLNNEESRQVTGSIGIALYPGSEKDSKALIKSADDAMYSAKAKGKNSYTFADN